MIRDLVLVMIGFTLATILWMKPMKSEFLQLAHVANFKKHMVAGRFMSEKLDGIRAFWDGGVSSGYDADRVPWANTEKDKKAVPCTGLWSRLGKVIWAPDSFLSTLPPFPLDMELHAGRGNFQLAMSLVRTQDASKDWSQLSCAILDFPHPKYVFADRQIKAAHDNRTLAGCLPWFEKRCGTQMPHAGMGFIERLSWLKNQGIEVHEQVQLPFNTPLAMKLIEEKLAEVLELDGEGLILKSANCLWLPERSYDVLKYKPFDDLEAAVVGYTWGRETDKGSKLKGKMGALICRIKAGEFKVSGFKDIERSLVYTKDGTSAEEAWVPDTRVPATIYNADFPIGSMVTIRYRELTDAKIPKEGRYHRRFDSVR